MLELVTGRENVHASLLMGSLGILLHFSTLGIVWCYFVVVFTLFFKVFINFTQKSGTSQMKNFFFSIGIFWKI